MNIDNFYLAQIYIITEVEHAESKMIHFYETFNEPVVVYRKNSCFYDLNSNERYRTFEHVMDVGDVFIGTGKIIPLRNILDEKNIRYKNNMGKYKVKRMIYGGKNEKNI